MSSKTLSLSLQEMASTRRAAPKCEPTSITFMSSTISRLCLSCHTDWSLGPKGQLRLCRTISRCLIYLSGLCRHPLEGVAQDKTVRGEMQKYLQGYTTVHNAWKQAQPPSSNSWASLPAIPLKLKMLCWCEKTPAAGPVISTTGSAGPNLLPLLLLKVPTDSRGLFLIVTQQLLSVENP